MDPQHNDPAGHAEQQFWEDLEIAAIGPTLPTMKGSNNVRSPTDDRDALPALISRKDARMISVTKRAVILVVEDELLIRMHAVEMIEEAGFEVAEAASADEAIAILESRPDISLIFTDIQMPGSIDGLKLAAAVRDRWPPILILATSGHVKIGAGDLPAGGRFVRKPYSPAEITKVLRELIAA